MKIFPFPGTLTALLLIMAVWCTANEAFTGQAWSQPPSRAPQRIISTSPGITEVLFSLDLGRSVVGVTSCCNYPADAKKCATIGSHTFSIEKIIALKPDLIIADRGLKPDTLTKLQKMGFALLIVDCSNLERFSESLLTVGKATGREEKARRLQKSLQKEITGVQKRIGPSSRRIRVFVEIWDRPLMTAGPGTFFDDLVDLAGGQNIFHDTGAPYPKVNMESLLARDPEVIILTTSKKEEIMGRQAWKDTTAVKKGQVFEINPDIIARPTLRLMKALHILAHWLHPEVFTVSGRQEGTHHGRMAE